MKKWLLFCVAALVWGRPTGWMGDYEAALNRAQQEKKPLLILMVKPGCEACGGLLMQITEDEALAEKIAGSTIPLLLTKGMKRYPIEMYYTPVYPTLFLVDGQERFLIDPVVPVSLPALRSVLEEKVFDER